jgi:hypothetical protein
MSTALVIHGHFYQPPRENPWTEIVDREPSAEPFHDWNERIYTECYRPNASARIHDSYGRVVRLVNNYRHLSFNFGPTLFTWLERNHGHIYRLIIEADRDSARARGGHGNAIAQGYNHSILPLCSDRDRITQVRWGVADFRHRFGRRPESLWLPETACDDATLGTLIDEGMSYVILSPYQAHRVRPIASDHWEDVSGGNVDPGTAYRYFHRDGSGRSIVIFFYDGPISRSIAFEGALASSQALVERISRANGGGGRIVATATDGESYGHHTRFGNRALAHALEFEAVERGYWITNFGEYLDHHAPTMEAEIKSGPDGEGTSWSCAHGVGRWYRDCGCHGGAQEGWNQAWRTPLREGLNFLSDLTAALFQSQGADLLEDPWAARDAYIELILDHGHGRRDFLRRFSGRQLGEREQEKALTLLEMQRNSMLMFTSCGWFFADISGIETVQVMKYAGRVLDLMEEIGYEPPRDRFLEYLAEAKSNIPEMGNGADVFRRFVDPCRVTALEVAAHLAISNLVTARDNATGVTAGYTHRRKAFRKRREGRLTLSTGRLSLETAATGRVWDLSFSAMHFGGIDYYCVLRPFPGRNQFREAVRRLWDAFPTASLPTILRIAREEFGPKEYGLEHVLPAGRQRISEIVFSGLIERFSQQYAVLYEESRRLLEMLQSAGFELPPELEAAAEFTLGKRLETETRRFLRNQDGATFQRAMETADEIHRRGYHIDRALSAHKFGEFITRSVSTALDDPSTENVRSLLALLDLKEHVGIHPDLHRPQELVYRYGRGVLPPDVLVQVASKLGFARSALDSMGPSAPPAPAAETTEEKTT